MFFLFIFGIEGDFVIAISIDQGKVYLFRIIRIIVIIIRGISSIIGISIWGISVGGISVGGHVFLMLGVILQYLLQFINKYGR